MLDPGRTRSAWSVLLLCVGLLLVHADASPQALTIKLGTLAPANTPWDDVLRGMAADWSRISDNRVEFKIFPGGIVGDEPDMVRKMRIGQLGAAAISVDGLSRIYSVRWPSAIRCWSRPTTSSR